MGPIAGSLWAADRRISVEAMPASMPPMPFSSHRRPSFERNDIAFLQKITPSLWFRRSGGGYGQRPWLGEDATAGAPALELQSGIRALGGPSRRSPLQRHR